MYKYIIGFLLATGLVFAGSPTLFTDGIRIAPKTNGSRPTGSPGQYYSNSTNDRPNYRTSGSSWINFVHPASTDTLTNKTIDADGTGNVISNIENADIKPAAGIAYSKLNLGVSILNSDVSGTAAIAYSKLNLTGNIVNADINASAAVAMSKLAAMTASRVAITDGSGFLSTADTTTYPSLTELSYVKNVTSSIQAQIDALIATGNLKTIQVKTFANSPFSAATTDDVILYSTGSGASRINLPAGFAGKTYRITKTSSDFNTLHVDANGGDLIREYGTSTTSGGSLLHTVNESVEYVWNATSNLWDVADRKTETPAISYTPTGSWSTNVTYAGKWSRDGNLLKGQVKITPSGAPDSTSLQINIPSGLTIDTTKVFADVFHPVGKGGYYENSAGIPYYGTVYYYSTTAVAPYAGFVAPTRLIDTPVTQAEPFAFGAADFVNITFEVPILGWN